MQILLARLETGMILLLIQRMMIRLLVCGLIACKVSQKLDWKVLGLWERRKSVGDGCEGSRDINYDGKWF